MSRRALMAGAVISGCLTLSAFAAQMGRQMVLPAEMESAPRGVEVRKEYSGPKLATRPGVDLGLDWNAMHWKASDGHNDQAWSPQLGLTFGATDMFDLRLSGRYTALKDGESDLQAFRIGVGTRAWIPVGHDFAPYAGAALNYYILDGKENGTYFRNVRGGVGLSAEAGIAYLINEFFSVRLGLQAETTIISGKADVGQDSTDLSLQGVGFGVGLNLVF